MLRHLNVSDAVLKQLREKYKAKDGSYSSCMLIPSVNKKMQVSPKYEQSGMPWRPSRVHVRL